MIAKRTCVITLWHPNRTCVIICNYTMAIKQVNVITRLVITTLVITPIPIIWLVSKQTIRKPPTIHTR